MENKEDKYNNADCYPANACESCDTWELGPLSIWLNIDNEMVCEECASKLANKIVTSRFNSLPGLLKLILIADKDKLDFFACESVVDTDVDWTPKMTEGLMTKIRSSEELLAAEALVNAL